MTKILKPSAIIFDFDDTLIDSKPITTKALFATLKKFNISKDIIDHMQIDTSRSMRDYFYQIFSHNIYQARDTYYEYYTEFSKDIKMLENAEKVLEYLNQHKVFNTIVSNKNGTLLRKEVTEHFQWDKYFQAVIGSGDASEDKPSMLPAKLALSKLNLPDYCNVLLIGDSLIDIQTAKNLGCKSILFGDDKFDADFKVENHNHLLDFFKNIYEN